MAIVMVLAAAFVVLAAMGYLAACAGAERWLSLREWIGQRRRNGNGTELPRWRFAPLEK